MRITKLPSIPSILSMTRRTSEWSPGSLLAGKVGHWSGGYAPPQFSPEQLIGGQSGHWSGGYAPPAFHPSQLIGGQTGHYSGGYRPEVQ